MATHYKGERIDELLGEIATIQDILKSEETPTDGKRQWELATAHMMLALRKAQLTSLQGDDK